MEQKRDSGLGVPARRLAVALSACTPRSFLASGYPLRSLTRNVVVGLLSVIASLVFASSTQACYCWFRAGMNGTDAVFTGKVVSIEQTDSSTVVSIRVKKTYKGTVPEDSTVQVILYGTNCDPRFRKAMKYVVYAYAGEGRMGTSICTHTRMMAPFRLWPFKPKQ